MEPIGGSITQSKLNTRRCITMQLHDTGPSLQWDGGFFWKQFFPFWILTPRMVFAVLRFFSLTCGCVFSFYGEGKVFINRQAICSIWRLVMFLVAFPPPFPRKYTFEDSSPPGIIDQQSLGSAAIAKGRGWRLGKRGDPVMPFSLSFQTNSEIVVDNVKSTTRSNPFGRDHQRPRWPLRLFI